MDYSNRTKEIAKEMLGDKLKDPMLVWEAVSLDGVKFPHQGCGLSDFQRKQNHAHEMNIIDDIAQQCWLKMMLLWVNLCVSRLSTT